uniref:Uncharacterized protein n=1 Tax=Candidatus Nitrotoga fabula TaxID=2182327 RepID=A0A2X0SP65_9PROT|nr:protein of unknown function [Candidatus Nitrotoga fabula]
MKETKKPDSSGIMAGNPYSTKHTPLKSEILDSHDQMKYHQTDPMLYFI